MKFNETEVNLSDGKVVLQEPNAIKRNMALLNAHGKAKTEKNAEIEMLFKIELLPYCIKSHPWGSVKVRDALNSLHYNEYDLLIEGLDKLLIENAELKKKSEPSVTENIKESSTSKSQLDTNITSSQKI